jgi:soluble epoxide hydrolase / lipid-phosphate phosphatase
VGRARHGVFSIKQFTKESISLWTPLSAMAIAPKTLVVTENTSYKYLASKAEPDKPTLLFLHGFPSCASDWANQTSFFASRGFGIIAPDLLGYGGTSKPEDVSAYNWKEMSAHVKAILDEEEATRVIGVGHDLGSWFLSRLCHFYPDTFAGLAFLTVGYSPPGERFDVELINRMTKVMTGEEKFRYWDFFTSDAGVALMDKNVESVLSLMYATSQALMAQNLGPAGRTQDWVANGRVAQTYLDAERLADKVGVFEDGGFTGPTNWYRALRENSSFADEEYMDRIIGVPTLVIGCGRDEMTLASLQDELTKPCVEGAPYRFELLEVGHWPMWENPDGTNRILESFFVAIAS